MPQFGYMDRVLEIGHFAAGYCGRLLIRTGAEVIRVEQAGLPAWASREAMDAYLHAGKQRLTPSSNATIDELANTADIVICEAATANELNKIGFHQWCTPVKVAITPFGLTGPRKNWLATPSTLLAMGGYTHLIGDPERAPLTLPGHYVEFQSGALAFTAANACRLANTEDVIDLSMFETVMSLSQFTTVRWHCAGDIRQRHGSDFHVVVPSDLFACRDGWVYINIVPTFWDAFTIFADLPELLLDERFATNDLRITNKKALKSVIAEVIQQFTRAELVIKADQNRIPMGVVMNFAEVLRDPHLAEREFWEHITIGDTSLKSPGIPWQINRAERPSLSLEAVKSEAGFTI